MLILISLRHVWKVGNGNLPETLMCHIVPSGIARFRFLSANRATAAPDQTDATVWTAHNPVFHNGTCNFKPTLVKRVFLSSSVGYMNVGVEDVEPSCLLPFTAPHPPVMQNNQNRGGPARKPHKTRSIHRASYYLSMAVYSKRKTCLAPLKNGYSFLLILYVFKTTDCWVARDFDAGLTS